MSHVSPPSVTDDAPSSAQPPSPSSPPEHTSRPGSISRALPAPDLSDLVSEVVIALAEAPPRSLEACIRRSLERVCTALHAPHWHLELFSIPGIDDQDLRASSLHLEGEGEKSEREESEREESEREESAAPASFAAPWLSDACLSALREGHAAWTGAEAPAPLPSGLVHAAGSDAPTALQEDAPAETSEDAPDTTGGLHLPLQTDGALRGVLSLRAPRRRFLTPAVLAALRPLAATVGSAFQRWNRAHAYEAVQKRHRRVLEDSGDLIFEVDETGVIRYVSPSVTPLTGYYPAEVVGTSLHAFLPANTPDSVDGLFQSVLADGEEIQLTDRYGEARYFRASLRSVQRDGDLCVISGVATDVTERREAEQALASEKAFTDRALNGLPGLFYLVDHRLHIRRWNQRLQDVLDVPDDQVAFCRFSELFAFRDRPHVSAHLHKALEGTTTQFEADVRIDGQPTPHAFTATPVEIGGKRFVAGMGTDISTLADTRTRLSESFEALREMHAISTEGDMPTARRIDRLLRSGLDYLGAKGAVVAQVDGNTYTVQHTAGRHVPEAGCSLALADTLCHTLLQQPPHTWPWETTRTANAPPLPHPLPCPTGGDVRYIGVPIHTQDGVYGTLSFAGNPEMRSCTNSEVADFLKLMAEWIGATISQDHARRAQQRSEHRFREIFAAAPDAYLIVDPATGCVTDCNEATFQLLEAAPKHVLGQPYTSLHPIPRKEIAERQWPWVERAVEHGTWRVKNMPVRKQSRDASDTIVDISARCVEINGQQRVLAVLRDVSQRKAAEDAAEDAAARSEAFSQQLQRLIHVGMGLTTDLQVQHITPCLVAGAVDVLPHAMRASLWVFNGPNALLLASDHPEVGCRIHRPTLYDPEWEPGDPIPTADHAQQAPPLSVLREEGGLFHTIDEHLTPVSIANARVQRSDYPELNLPFFEDARSLLVTPVTGANGKTGALVVCNTEQPGAFTEDETALLTSLATQAALALNNAATLRKLQATSQRLMQAQEEERRHLAQELHDETGGLLTSLQFKLQEAQLLLDASPDGDAPASTPSHSMPSETPQEEPDAAPDAAATAALANAKDLTKRLASLLRRFAQSLRPKILDDLGLSAALPWLVEDIGDRMQPEVSLACEISPGTRYPTDVETAAFRIVQEALTNAARYADADRVEVIVNVEADTLRIHVIDDGNGFDLTAWAQSNRTTLGLSGMTERAEQLGGSLEIDTAPNEGTRISATLSL